MKVLQCSASSNPIAHSLKAPLHMINGINCKKKIHLCIYFCTYLYFITKLLQSGKVYLQRSSAVSISDHQSHSNPTVPMMQDLNLNFPPSPTSKTPLKLFDDTSTSLELKLVSSSSPPPQQPSSCNFQSLCTLDKVKSALERAEREPIKKRATSLWKSSLSSSPSYSSSLSSIKETQEEDSEFSSPFAAGCPGCLSYVLIMRNNPKCPRCNSVIPMPMSKKSRIDLNRTN